MDETQITFSDVAEEVADDVGRLEVSNKLHQATEHERDRRGDLCFTVQTLSQNDSYAVLAPPSMNKIVSNNLECETVQRQSYQDTSIVVLTFEISEYTCHLVIPEDPADEDPENRDVYSNFDFKSYVDDTFVEQ